MFLIISIRFLQFFNQVFKFGSLMCQSPYKWLSSFPPSLSKGYLLSCAYVCHFFLFSPSQRDPFRQTLLRWLQTCVGTISTRNPLLCASLTSITCHNMCRLMSSFNNLPCSANDVERARTRTQSRKMWQPLFFFSFFSVFVPGDFNYSNDDNDNEMS